MHFAYEISQAELAEWEKWYLPPPSVSKDNDLILDVGARDGDTALFYLEHGYRRLRLIEPNLIYVDDLMANVREMGAQFNADIEVRFRPFKKEEDLLGVAFAKFDCEGCEAEAGLNTLTIPWAAELHEKNKPDEKGVYPYVAFTGYARGP